MNADTPLRVAVVGSGPAGFYAAGHLLASGLPVDVDMIERLPTPWGLVRLGVAPDHPNIKAVSRVFEKIAQRPGFRFLGKVELGRDLRHEDFVVLYDAVVYAYGAPTDRRLGIPGEDLPGSWAATEFVAWYNGHPDFQDLSFDLSGERAVVIGNGNVALDVARRLARGADGRARDREVRDRLPLRRLPGGGAPKSAVRREHRHDSERGRPRRARAVRRRLDQARSERRDRDEQEGRGRDRPAAAGGRARGTAVPVGRGVGRGAAHGSQRRGGPVRGLGGDRPRRASGRRAARPPADQALQLGVPARGRCQVTVCYKASLGLGTRSPSSWTTTGRWSRSQSSAFAAARRGRSAPARGGPRKRVRV